jgi:hypothetical protein
MHRTIKCPRAAGTAGGVAHQEVDLMDNWHRSRDADARSAARVVRVLREEAEARRGTVQAEAWTSIANAIARRWPEGALGAVPDDQDRS